MIDNKVQVKSDYLGLVIIFGIGTVIFLIFYIVSTLPKEHLDYVMAFLKTNGSTIGGFFGVMIMGLIGFFTFRMKRNDKEFQIKLISDMDSRTTEMVHKNDIFMKKSETEISTIQTFVTDSLNSISNIIDTFKDELQKDRDFISNELMKNRKSTDSQFEDLKIGFIESNAEMVETNTNLKEYIREINQYKNDRDTYERRLHSILTDRLPMIPTNGIPEITEAIRNKSVEFIEYAVDVQKMLNDKSLTNSDLLQIMTNNAKKRSESIKVNMIVTLGSEFTNKFYNGHHHSVDAFMTSIENAVNDPFNGRKKHIQDISVVFLRSFISIFGKMAIEDIGLIQEHISRVNTQKI